MKLAIVFLMALSGLGLVAGQNSGGRILKNRVKEASRDLQFYNTIDVSNARSQLRTMKIDKMRSVNKATKRVADLIKDNAAAAKKEGKDADHCYESVKPQLGDASRKAFFEFDECLKNELAAFDELKRNIELHQLQERSLLSRIDAGAISCIGSANTLQMQVCDAQEMLSVVPAVNAYENAAKELKRTGDRLSFASRGSLSRCLQQQLNDLDVEVEKIRKSAVKCIDTA